MKLRLVQSYQPNPSITNQFGMMPRKEQRWVRFQTLEQECRLLFGVLKAVSAYQNRDSLATAGDNYRQPTKHSHLKMCLQMPLCLC
ncbi:hypothetical protein SAMD00079811_71130 [Scytonema sp. HK-05]|nr:hypothetical protein SAMD00079811_71130 [Scytonema sp. HK-05]